MLFFVRLTLNALATRQQLIGKTVVRPSPRSRTNKYQSKTSRNDGDTRVAFGPEENGWRAAKTATVGFDLNRRFRPTTERDGRTTKSNFEHDEFWTRHNAWFLYFSPSFTTGTPAAEGQRAHRDLSWHSNFCLKICTFYIVVYTDIGVIFFFSESYLQYRFEFGQTDANSS